MCADSKFCSNGGTKRNVYIIAGVAVGALFFLLFIVGNPLLERLFVEKEGDKRVGCLERLILKLI